MLLLSLAVLTIKYSTADLIPPIKSLVSLGNYRYNGDKCSERTRVTWPALKATTHS